MSDNLLAQVAFERALGMAALESLSRAIAANVPQHVIDDHMTTVLNGPGLGLVETGQVAHLPMLTKLVLAARNGPS